MELEKINGNEIVDFLNHLTEENDEPHYEYNICTNSFRFVDQQIENENGIQVYVLYFTVDYNNWGEDQEIDNNRVVIDRVGVKIKFEDPIEGSGAEEFFEDFLTNWLKKHVFHYAPEEQFDGQMREIYEKMPEIDFSNTKAMDELIKDLQKARSLMKNYKI